MKGLPAATRAGGALFALAAVAFAAMWLVGTGETAMAAPAVAGWAGALVALRPLVPEKKRTTLYFAFGIMAFLIFFLHETYRLQGTVRYFPLLVGWTGAVLSLLDILSLTDTRPGRAVATFFGSTLTEAPDDERTLGREVACFAAVGGGVLLAWLFGFLIASPLFVFLWMWLWGGKPVRQSLYGAAAIFAFVWILFEVLLSYELYQGIVVEWLVETWRG